MNKILYLDINRICNNNCIGCAIDSSKTGALQKSFKEIKKELEEGIKHGYNILHPIGGETTLHLALLKILKKAKGMYKEIALTSNGRIFSYESFVKKFKDLPITFNITLCGPNQEIHEAWTRTPGSFKQTIMGIKNLVKHKKKVCLNMLLWKKAVDNLGDYIKLIKNLKPDELSILKLGPFGRCKNKFNTFSPTLIELTKLNEFLKKAKNLVKEVDVEDFPMCIFEKKLFKIDNLHFHDISSSLYLGKDGKIETLGLFAANEQGYNINSIKLNKCDLKILENKITSYKIKLKPCLDCEFWNRCKGIYKKYKEWKGKKTIEKELIQLKRLYKIR